METKDRRSGIQKTVTTHKSQNSSRHSPYVLIWSNLLSSLLLCTKEKRVLILRPLQKLELLECHVEQISAYQTQSPEKEINSKLFDEADSLVYNILSYPL